MLPGFAQVAENDVKGLQKQPNSDVDLEEFIDAASLVHEAIRDIRHALLMNRSD